MLEARSRKFEVVSVFTISQGHSHMITEKKPCNPFHLRKSVSKTRESQELTANGKKTSVPLGALGGLDK